MLTYLIMIHLQCKLHFNGYPGIHLSNASVNSHGTYNDRHHLKQRQPVMELQQRRHWLRNLHCHLIHGDLQLFRDSDRNYRYHQLSAIINDILFQGERHERCR